LAVLRLRTSSIFADCWTGGLLAFENSAGVDTDLTVGIGQTAAVARQATSGDELGMTIEEWIVAYDECTNPRLDNAAKAASI
jgi:hypothetical protein